MIGYIEFQIFRYVCIRIYRSIKTFTTLHQFKIIYISREHNCLRRSLG